MEKKMMQVIFEDYLKPIFGTDEGEFIYETEIFCHETLRT